MLFFADFFFTHVLFFIQELVCSTQQQNADELLKMVADSPHEYCLSQKARIILIVIDALKYEFGLFDSSKYTQAHNRDVAIT